MNIFQIIKFLIEQTIVIAPPILITSVGACLSERSGVVNIGLEGIMLSGAFATTVVNIATGNPYLGKISVNNNICDCDFKSLSVVSHCPWT